MDEAAKKDGSSGATPRFNLRRWIEVAFLINLVGLIFAASHWTQIPVCPSRALFGVPCAGCGMTRATLALFAFDLHGVLHYHPLAPLVVPSALYAVGVTILEYTGAIPPGQSSLGPRWLWPMIGVSLLVVYAIRVAGGLGGLPDPIEPEAGIFNRLPL